jgi:O-antigen ligase
VAIVLWILFFIISFAGRLKRQEYRAFFLSATVVAVFLGSIFLTPLFYRFAQTTTSEESFVHRESLMTAAAQMIADKPIFGVGLGNFLPTLSTIQHPFSASTYFQPVHNIYLLVASELGIVGFAFFIFFIFKTYERLRKNALARVCGFMFTAIVVLGFFDHYFLTLQQSQLLFALIVGLSWSKVKA